MNKTQIVANWKMNTTISDSINISTKLSNASLDINNIDITICHPALYLAQVHQILKNSSLKIGAQNIHSEEEGAYTGEISAKMISDYCDTVILGHSERRQIFKESNQDINKKFLLAKKFVYIFLKKNLIYHICLSHRAGGARGHFWHSVNHKKIIQNVKIQI